METPPLTFAAIQAALKAIERPKSPLDRVRTIKVHPSELSVLKWRMTHHPKTYRPLLPTPPDVVDLLSGIVLEPDNVLPLGMGVLLDEERNLVGILRLGHA